MSAKLCRKFAPDAMFLDDGTQNVNRNRNPQLTLDYVFRHAVKRFDAQMLLDPLEEQFHLPATLVQFGNGERRPLCIVGQKHQFLAAF